MEARGRLERASTAGAWSRSERAGGLSPRDQVKGPCRVLLDLEASFVFFWKQVAEEAQGEVLRPEI